MSVIFNLKYHHPSQPPKSCVLCIILSYFMEGMYRLVLQGNYSLGPTQNPWPHELPAWWNIQHVTNTQDIHVILLQNIQGGMTYGKTYMK